MDGENLIRENLIRENLCFLVSSVAGCMRSFILVHCSSGFLAMHNHTTDKSRLKLVS